MELTDSLEEFAPVAKAFHELNIRYQLGGSVASSAYGFPRGTQDIDVEAEIREEHVEALVEKLEERYIITTGMIREAIRSRRSFNLIPYDSLAKIDIFIPKQRPYDQMAATRRQFGIPLDDGVMAEYYVDSAEDVILRKLEWYRMGGEVSNQKWLDVLGVLKAQQFDLDFDYLREWAPQLRVDDLLEKAFDQAGLKSWLDKRD